MIRGCEEFPTVFYLAPGYHKGVVHKLSRLSFWTFLTTYLDEVGTYIGGTENVNDMQSFTYHRALLKIYISLTFSVPPTYLALSS